MNNWSWNAEYLKNRGLIFWWRYFPYNPNLSDRAKDLRKNMTPPEKKIWYNYFNSIFIPLNKGEDFLKENQGDSRLVKIKVLRQKIIDNYIVDFYLPELKLIIEIDWEVHDERKEYDAIRTEILEWYWLQEIRILNSRIENNFDEICKKLDIVIKNLFYK